MRLIMAIDTVVELQLDTLICHRADDGSFGGGADPYLWPALIVLQGLEPFTAFPEDDQFRVSIKDGISNGESASIPTRVGQLRVNFQSESLESRKLKIIVIALLLEDNGTSKQAIKAGFLAFKAHLFAILVANANDPKAGATALAEAVSTAAKRAGTLWDGIKGFFSVDGDSLTGAAFLDTGGPKQIALEINNFLSLNWFTIGGGVSVTPPDQSLPDPCFDKVVALNQSNTALAAAEAQLDKLREEFARASPTEKPRKQAAIGKFERGPLKRAQDAADLAMSQLELCRQTQ
jgi:hypothetical protein